APVGDWRLGALAGYSATSFSVGDRASSGSSESYHVGLYGGRQWGALGFRSGLAYSWNDIDTSRSVSIPGFGDRLTGKYNAGLLQAFGELGYRIDTPAIAFEPFANLAYVSLHTDGFTEQGGAAALSASGMSTDTTFTTLGLRGSLPFGLGGITGTLRGTIGWRHAFGDTTPLSTLSFAGSDAFTIAGVPIAKDAAVFDAGLDLNLSPTATFGIGYQGQFSDGANRNGFNAKLSVKF
ncbi:autotransporter outer membrane beta-barrel domain-containing protein, partial [Bradyrhizobium sp.]|uniref:autotransporter outer membrane beta-barrel domain-containing protein n=1 Tax=Bradyrhizobium sp. TaxID=376 RepID=UPI0039E47A37